MRNRGKRITALFLAAMLVLTPQASTVYAADVSENNSEVQMEVAAQSEDDAQYEVSAQTTELDPPTKLSVSQAFWGGFMINDYYGTETYKWISKVSGVTIDNVAWTKVNSSLSIGDNKNYYANGDGYLYIGEDFAPNPATCVITADGYKPLTLSLDKTNHSATVMASGSDNGSSNAGEEEKTYTATVGDTTNGSLTLSATSDIEAGSTVTVTATPDSGYELEALTVTGAESKEEIATVNTSGNDYTFIMPKENVVVAADFKAYIPGNITLSGVRLSEDSFGQDWYLTFTDTNYVANVTEVTVNDVAWEAKPYGISSGGAYKKDTENNRLVFAQKDFSSSPTIPVLSSGDVVTIKAKGYEDLTFKFVVDTDGKASLVEDDGKGDPYELHVKIDGSFEAAIVGQKDYDGVSSASVGGSSSNKNSAVKVYGALVEKDTEPADTDWEELDNMSKISLDGGKCSVSIVPDTEKGTPEGSDSGMEGVYMTISSDLTLNGTPKDAGQYLISVTIADNQGRTATSNALPFRIYTGQEKLADQISLDNMKQYASGLYAWDIMEPWVIEAFGSNVEGEEESVRVPKDLEAWFGSHESGTYGYLGYDIAWKDVLADKIPQTLYIPDGCNLTLTNMEVLSSVRIVIEKGGKLTLSDSVVQGIIEVKDGGTFSMNYDAYSGNFTTGASVCGQIRMEDGAILENAAIYSHINYLANGNTADRSSADAVVVTNGNVTVKGQVFIEGDSAGSEGIGQTALRVQNGTLTLEDGAALVTYGGDGTVNLYSEGGHAVELENGTITGKGKFVAIGGYVLWGDGGTAVTGNGTISTNEVFLQGATSFTSNHAAPGMAINGDVKVKSPNQHIEDGAQLATGTDDPLGELYWKTGIDPMPPLDKFTTSPVEHEHTFVWVIDKEPTQKETGLKHEECEECGATRNENTVIDKLPADNGNNGNAGENGNTGTNGNTGDNSNAENSGNTGDNGTTGNSTNVTASVTTTNTATAVSENGEITVENLNDWQKVNLEVVNSPETKKDEIHVNVSADAVMPAYVVESLKDKECRLVLTLANGVTWIIYGKDVTADSFQDIDLGVVLGTSNVPTDLVSSIADGKEAGQFSLDYSGEFGFKVTLTLPTGKQHAGMYAKLYYYNETTGKLEYITSEKVDENGNVRFEFTHASDYVLVYDTIATVKTGDQSPMAMALILLFAGFGCILLASKKKFVK